MKWLITALPFLTLALTLILGVLCFAAEDSSVFYGLQQPIGSIIGEKAPLSEILLNETKGDVMDSVNYYKNNNGGGFIYELRPDYGNVIPYAKGRYRDCYYPLGSGFERPEFYTWDAATMAVEGDYVKITPAKNGEFGITFDTSPKSYYISYDNCYCTVSLKTASAFDGYIQFKTLDSALRKSFTVKFTGEWQKIILDLSDKGGWEIKDTDGTYKSYSGTPFSDEINKMYGGHAIRLLGKDYTESYTFDYIAFLPTLDVAKAFIGLAEVKSTALPVLGRRSITDAVNRPYLYFMNGYADKTFRPNNGMTRAEACTVVARLLDSEDIISTDRATLFTDIEKDEWYYNYVTYLESQGILDAFKGEFLPNQKITRAEFVNILFESNGFPENTDSQSVFTDVSSNTKFFKEIQSANSSGIIKCYTDGTFRPDNTVTRAEIAVLLCRILGTEETPDAEQLFDDFTPSHWAYPTVMAIISPETLKVDYEAGNLKIAEIDRLAAEKKQNILNTKTEVSITGTSYFVSNEGNDANDGKTPDTAWKTLVRVTNAALHKGDGVFFRRGDIFRGRLRTKMGVTYSAYGEGEKPRIYGSPENGAVATKWTLYNAENNIWKYETKMVDQGTLVFNDGESYAIKLIPNFSKEKACFITDSGNAFIPEEQMKNDLELFSETVDNLNSAGYPDPGSSTGYIYLRCDRGNPGEIFESIEFMPSYHIIRAQADDYRMVDITFDNIAVMYGGAHGIHCNRGENYTVQNCVFEWIGGGIQSYTLSSGGRAVRYGNAVELGSADNHVIKNCYINQLYDCGLTFQSGVGGSDDLVTNVTYEDNLIENCTYSIECFMGEPKTEGFDKYIKNFTVRNNIMRYAGYGFGSTRPDKTTPAHIKTWNSYNKVKDRSFIIENNIFDRSTYMMLHTGIKKPENLDSLPILRNNTYVQHLSSPQNTATFGIYGFDALRHGYDENLPLLFKAKEIDDLANVYFVE